MKATGEVTEVIIGGRRASLGLSRYEKGRGREGNPGPSVPTLRRGLAEAAVNQPVKHTAPSRQLPAGEKQAIQNTFYVLC